MKRYCNLITLLIISWAISAGAKELSEMSREELIAALGEADEKLETCFESQAGVVESLGDPVKDSAWLLVNVFCRSETVQHKALIEMIDLRSPGLSLTE